MAISILINSQLCAETHFFQFVRLLANKKCIKKIYISSALMHKIEDEQKNRLNSLPKVEFIFDIAFSDYNHLLKNEFSLDAEMLFKQKNMFSTILSSYRWLPISERKQFDFTSFSSIYYYEILNFWHNFFQQNTIDLVINTGTQHSSIDSLLNDVAKEINAVDVITLKIVGCNLRYYEDYFALFNETENKYIHIKNLGVADYKGEAQGSNDNFIFSSQKNNRLLNLALEMKRLVLKLILKCKSGRLAWREIFDVIKRKIKTSISLNKQIRYLKSLSRYYEKLAVKKLDIHVHYVYYCAHFDPEASTLPSDDYMYNQLLNLRILHASLPTGWVIYFKEHPEQLKYTKYKSFFLNQLHSVDGFRSRNFYQYASSLENVMLVGDNNPHHDLIRNAQFIASNSGTVFREATDFGKRGISFSKVGFYSMLDHIHVVDSIETCRAILHANSKTVENNIDELFNRYTVTTKMQLVGDTELDTSINLQYKVLEKYIDTRNFALGIPD